MAHGKPAYPAHWVSTIGKIHNILIAFVCACLFSCGGASPPVGIPSPVSNLMTISNPDSSGSVTLTGAPGAVLPGAIVTAANTSQQVQKSSPIETLFFGTAWAQSGTTQADTIAASDGSFELTLSGQVGETVQVVQTVAGQTSPPTDLVIQGTVIDLGVVPHGLAVDENSGTAYVTADPGTAGLVFKLNLNSFDPLPSKPPPSYSFDGFPSLKDIAVDPIAQNGFAVAPGQNALLTFDLTQDGTTAKVRTFDNPLTVRTLPSAGITAVGLGSTLASVVLVDSASGEAQCSLLLTHPVIPSLNHLQTPFVSIFEDSDGVPTLVALSQFSDGSWMLSRVPGLGCSTVPSEINKVLLSGSIQPGGLSTFDFGDGALITDTKANQLLQVSFDADNSSPVTVGHGPKGVAVENKTGTVFVVNSLDNSITHLDLDSQILQNLIGVGLGPSEIAIDGNLGFAVVLSELDSTVVIVDLNKTL